MCKRPKKKGIPSNFHEFQSEEVHYKKYAKNKTLIYEHYNLVDPMEWQVVIFLRLMSNKVIQRFYNYFLKFSYYVKNYKVWPKNHKEF
jgi:hypothetical protein